ncbi:hypothetical protein ACVXHA_03075 [Escherichia coli]
MAALIKRYAAEAQKYGSRLANQQFNTIMNNLKPFTPLADKYVGSLENYRLWKGKVRRLTSITNSQQYKRPCRSGSLSESGERKQQVDWVPLYR